MCIMKNKLGMRIAITPGYLAILYFVEGERHKCLLKKNSKLY